MTNDATFEIDTDSRLESPDGWTTDTTGPTRDVLWDSFSLPEMTFDTNGVLHVTGTNVTSIKWTVGQKDKSFLLDGGNGSGFIQLSMIPNPEMETALGTVTVEDPMLETKFNTREISIVFLVVFLTALALTALIAKSR